MRVLDALLPKRSEALPEQFLNPWGPYGLTSFTVAGQTYQVPLQTTLPGEKAESIGNSFEGYALGGLMANSVVFSLAAVRMRVFSEARFQFQQLRNGRPGDLFGTGALSTLETPWPGGTTGDLLAVMLLHADFAGNAYVTNINEQLVAMRPDWVDIVLAGRPFTDSRNNSGTVGMEKVGYAYHEGGRNMSRKPMFFLADEVAHFAPQPDPLAWYRGMSWLTPIIREVQADGAMTSHKLKFHENAATPNLAVSLKEITDPQQFEEFVDKMDEQHKGWSNAYKTLYTAGGADVTVIGANMRELDFVNVQGKGETRMASAAGVPPSVAGLSEGLQGSSLNAGNFGASRRQFADTTLSALWRNVSGSLQTLITPMPGAARLWYDVRDIPFLREDQSDVATIQEATARSIRELYMAGFEPDSIIAAVTGHDMSLLQHTGLYSIQVQSPGTTSTKLPSTVDEPPPPPVGAVIQKPAIAALPAPTAPLAGANGKKP